MAAIQFLRLIFLAYWMKTYLIRQMQGPKLIILLLYLLEAMNFWPISIQIFILLSRTRAFYATVTDLKKSSHPTILLVKI